MPSLTGRPPGPAAAMEGSALPIRRHRRALVEAVRERPFLIVTGETGSGKSTQLPKYLFEAGNGRGGGEPPESPLRSAAWAAKRGQQAQINAANPPAPSGGRSCRLGCAAGGRRRLDGTF